MLGNYVAANFNLIDDGHGGTRVFDPPVDSSGHFAPVHYRALHRLKAAMFQAVYRGETYWYGPPRRGREWPFCRLESTT